MLLLATARMKKNPMVTGKSCHYMAYTSKYRIHMKLIV